ncbi:MAG: transposase [Candidatus Omnitrophica bacterium]|nr:transposase [Candidatus Omnitrophota bacterium]
MENACYHIVSRGNQKQFIFPHDDDLEKLLSIIRKYKLAFKVKIYSYCIMGNHYHILLDPPDIKALTKLMQGVNMSYTQYYNYKYNKCGHLWQGRYKSYIITKNSYMYNCVNYIEYNPVRANIVDKPESYKWSSYCGRNGLSQDLLLDQITL